MSTAPGFWVRIDLTVWNTSTTPSVLHCWVTMVMAQNIPDLPTVSLDRRKHHVISHDPRHRVRRYLQCTTMGWFPVLLCTLSTSSMTSVMVARLVHTPSGDQLVMWNWVTCCIWVLCVFCADQSQIIIRYMLHIHLHTMCFSKCTNSRQSTHRYGEVHNTHRYGDLHNTHRYGELPKTHR